MRSILPAFLLAPEGTLCHFQEGRGVGGEGRGDGEGGIRRWRWCWLKEGDGEGRKGPNSLCAQQRRREERGGSGTLGREEYGGRRRRAVWLRVNTRGRSTKLALSPLSSLLGGPLLGCYRGRGGGEASAKKICLSGAEAETEAEEKGGRAAAAKPLGELARGHSAVLFGYRPKPSPPQPQTGN